MPYGSRRGRTFVALMGALLAALLCVSIGIYRDDILEFYLIRRFHEVEGADLHACAFRLGELHSTRALPHMLEYLEKDNGRSEYVVFCGTESAGKDTQARERVKYSPMLFAIHLVGEPALPLLKSREDSASATDSMNTLVYFLIDGIVHSDAYDIRCEAYWQYKN